MPSVSRRTDRDHSAARDPRARRAGGEVVSGAERFSITKQRGQWFEGPNGIPLIATFHPAYILRQTGGELNASKRLVWSDLKAVRTKLDELASDPQVQVIVEQTDLFSL